MDAKERTFRGSGASSARWSALALLLVAAAGCATEEVPAATPAHPAPVAPAAPLEIPGHSVDVAAIDRAVRPGDDFFGFANGGWLEKTTIPADEVEEDVWVRVGRDVEAATRALLEASATAPAGSDRKRIGDYYASFVDQDAIDKRGLAPLAPTLARIAKIPDKRALAAELGRGLRPDVDALNAGPVRTPNLFGLWVEQSFSDPTKNAAFLMQGGLLLPDRDFYLAAGKAKDDLRAKYQQHLATILKLAGVADPEAKAARVLALEKKIAAAHVSRTESEDVTKANNPWPLAELAKRAPGLDWSAFLGAAHLDKEPMLVAWQPSAITGLAALVKSEPLDAWKDWLVAHAISGANSVLPRPIAEEHLRFFWKELRGGEALPPRWRLGVWSAIDTIGEDVGKVYVADHFAPESKKRIQDMVARMRAVYAQRIDALAWMSPATKAKAKAKLGTIRVGIGYPDAWRTDTGFDVVRGDAFGNWERAQARDVKNALAKLHGPVRRGEWVMTPETVDAVNLPVRNEIHFPAAILVKPFFGPERTDAANYGAIGAIIGHEISHSFDAEGAKFDADGRLANWWTPEDLAHFKASCGALAAQFDAYKPFPDANVDGKLTLSENIADLAGLSAAYDAWRASLDGKEPPRQDGLTGDQQFFLAWAQVWQAKWRDALLREQLVTNPHAPPRYRADTARNLDAFYRAFDVATKDALFVAPEARVRVW